MVVGDPKRSEIWLLGQPTSTGGAKEKSPGDRTVLQTDCTQHDVHDRVSKSGEETESLKLNTSKRKRRRRKEKKVKLNKLTFVANNANGIMNKLKSLENIFRENPSVVFLHLIGLVG